MEENTNIDMFEETKENYLQSSKYVEAHLNVLDEIPHSYSHQGNLKLDETMYTVETWDHESMDSKVVRLLSKVCAFYEEEIHAIMDCPFVPFHIETNITKHMEI